MRLEFEGNPETFQSRRTFRRISSLSMSTCKASSISCKTCSSTLFNFNGCGWRENIKVSDYTSKNETIKRESYRIRNEVSWVNLISPLLHVLGSALFVHVRYQMEELRPQSKHKIQFHVNDDVTYFKVSYQAGGVAVKHDKIHENGQVCIVLPQFGQGFEHSVIVDLSLKTATKDIKRLIFARNTQNIDRDIDCEPWRIRDQKIHLLP